MLVTSCPYLMGYEISEYRGLISGDAANGTAVVAEKIKKQKNGEVSENIPEEISEYFIPDL